MKFKSVCVCVYEEKKNERNRIDMALKINLFFFCNSHDTKADSAVAALSLNYDNRFWHVAMYSTTNNNILFSYLPFNRILQVPVRNDLIWHALKLIVYV